MSLLAETLHPFQTAAKIRTAVEGRGPDFHNFQSAACLPSNVGNYPHVDMTLLHSSCEKDWKPETIEIQIMDTSCVDVQ